MYEHTIMSRGYHGPGTRQTGMVSIRPLTGEGRGQDPQLRQRDWAIGHWPPQHGGVARLRGGRSQGSRRPPPQAAGKGLAGTLAGGPQD